MTCKNCEYEFEGNYCPKCGQKSTVRKISTSNVIEEVSSSLFQLDRGLLYTVKVLTLRPGKSLQAYLEGKRRPFIKPIAYVLTLTSLYYILALLFNQNTWIDDIISGWIEGVTERNEDAEIPTIVGWISKQFAYISLVLLPVFSLASYWSFKKYKLNYAEHIVINAYITGQQSIIYALFVLILSITGGGAIESVPLFLSLIYCSFVFIQFFEQGSVVERILRTILTYILYLFFCFLAMIALFVIIKVK